jgi:hypothetical protein
MIRLEKPKFVDIEQKTQITLREFFAEVSRVKRSVTRPGELSSLKREVVYDFFCCCRGPYLYAGSFTKVLDSWRYRFFRQFSGLRPGQASYLCSGVLIWHAYRVGGGGVWAVLFVQLPCSSKVDKLENIIGRSQWRHAIYTPARWIILCLCFVIRRAFSFLSCWCDGGRESVVI